jgi:hypothetical protein
VLRDVELALRADLIVSRLQASRDELHRERALGAVDAAFELGWNVVGPAWLCGSIGAELAFGATDVRLGGVTVADIPPLRAVAEGGVRFRF